MAALNGGNREDSMIGLIDMLAGAGHTPSRVVARGEAVSTAERALESLSDEHRQAVLLVHIEGMPIAEAASLMGRTERSVHGSLRRGLEELREHLGRESRFLNVTG